MLRVQFRSVTCVPRLARPPPLCPKLPLSVELITWTPEESPKNFRAAEMPLLVKLPLMAQLLTTSVHWLPQLIPPKPFVIVKPETVTTLEDVIPNTRLAAF